MRGAARGDDPGANPDRSSQWDHARDVHHGLSSASAATSRRDRSGSGAVPGGAGRAAGGPAGAERDAAPAGVAGLGAGGRGGGRARRAAGDRAGRGGLGPGRAGRARLPGVSPRTGLRVAPSASTLDRLPEMLDPDEFEAALTAGVADAALDPAVPAAYAAHRAEAAARAGSRSGRRGSGSRRPRRASGRKGRTAGSGAHPLHPWLDPAVAADPGHVPARRGVAVDGKERKLAKAGGKKKVHLLAAVTHVPGLVIAQDRVAKSGKANEITPLQAAAGARCRWTRSWSRPTPCRRTGTTPASCARSRTRISCGRSSATSRT